MLVTNIRVDHEEAVMVIERWRRICKITTLGRAIWINITKHFMEITQVLKLY